MSLNNAYILGCSHAAGSEMKKAVGIQNSYPCLLAKSLGYNSINYAIPGGSNDAMFRLLIENINKITTKDIVIACWSGLNRTEIYNSQKKSWQIINMSTSANDYHKAWQVNHGEEKFGQLNKIKNILALNSLCQRQQIKVINIDSFWPVWDVEIQDLFTVKENFWDYSLAKKFTKTDQGHFDLEAHKDFADYILRNINELH